MPSFNSWTSCLTKRDDCTVRETERLSSLLSVPLIGHGVYYFSIMLTSLLIAIEPHPDPGCLWHLGANKDVVDTSSCQGGDVARWIFYYILSPPLWLAIAIVIQVLLVHSLFAPANVTSACQRLASAVNRLRAPIQPDGVSAKLATPEELMKIEGTASFALYAHQYHVDYTSTGALAMELRSDCARRTETLYERAQQRSVRTSQQPF
jgi:hypothetical protein